MEYIIVQAGGKGTRLKHLTKNKPKALVPVENLPMLFHLFRKYPEKKYIIIGDYKKEVLREYLKVFANVKYQMVEACGTGTCSGIRQALKYIPANQPFMLIWSDLILPKGFEIPEDYEDEKKIKEDYIGISKTFSCRWSYKDSKFTEEKSYENGVAGLFLFSDKNKIKDVPVTGEFVRWLSEKGHLFSCISLAGTKEFGVIEEYEKLEVEKCRPFNRITIEGNILVKEALDDQGKELAQRECAWYEKAIQNKIKMIPTIYEKIPLKMEYIKGKNIYECELEYLQKKELLKELINAIQNVHNSESVDADYFSIKEAYFNKTMKRLSKIQDLVPFAKEKEIVINDKVCKNIFYHKRELELALEQIECEKFVFLHGDCTFSNLMIREDGSPVLIDPRGYFGYTELFGDERYDWAKLYYSIVGNYDRFNLKDFTLDIKENGINLQIESNNWEDMEEEFFVLTGTNKKEIQLLHAIIWLSLSTYAWQDYDSICGAFYNGLYYLQDVLFEENI